MGRILLFGAGVLFAIGLGVSGMTLPSNVQGFLDVTGEWKPALLFVMGGAVVTYAIAYRLITRRKAPLYVEAFPAAPPKGGYGKLVLGAAIFGVGWALSGYCPGPAVVSVGVGSAASVAYIGAMLVGMWAARRLEAKDQRAVQKAAQPAISPNS